MSGFNQDDLENQWSQAEKQMGREMYESQVAMQQASVEAAQTHVKQDEQRMRLMDDENARAEVRIVMLSKAVDFGLVIAASMALPVVVGLWRKAMK